MKQLMLRKRWKWRYQCSLHCLPYCVCGQGIEKTKRECFNFWRVHGAVFTVSQAGDAVASSVGYIVTPDYDNTIIDIFTRQVPVLMKKAVLRL